MRVDANGIQFRCLTDGDGPLVLLLHGFPQSAHLYRNLIPALAEAGFRAVAPDLRGYGQTTRPTRVRDYRLEILGDDIAALIRALGADRAHVMGHDWGGAVAWETAMSHPDVVDRLVAVNCPPAPALAHAMRTNLRQLRRSWYVFVFSVPWLAEWLLTRRHAALLSRAFSGSVITTEDEGFYRDAICRPGAASAALAYYRAAVLGACAESRRLRGRKAVCPTLVLWGERDPNLGKELTDDLQRYVRGPLQLQRFPEVGHWLIDDRPDEVAGRVISFLSG